MKSLVEQVLAKRAAEERPLAIPECDLCGVKLSKPQFPRCLKCRKATGMRRKRNGELVVDER